MIAPATNEAAGPRVALCPLGGSMQPELALLLARRGVASNIATLSDARRQEVGAIAAVARSRLTRSMVAELAPLCRDAAEASRPVVMLAPTTAFSSSLARAQISGFLASAGAIVTSNPDTWLETVVLIAAFGLPRGPRTALVFPSGGWLDDAAESLARERVSSRLRAVLAPDPSDLAPTDIVLCDPGELPASTHIEGLVVAPLVGRGELVSDGSPPTLVGLRAALEAAEAAGELQLRLAEGLGNASGREGPGDFDLDLIDERVAKFGRRVGDQETKIMLKAAGVTVTRQTVADTPSAAARLAKRVGFPVEMKNWGPKVADELSGCQLERELRSAADVRRAFAALCASEKDSVIIRETPPTGRELSVLIDVDKILGPMMTVRIAGQREPLAAVSPLSEFDAERLSRGVAATRVDDPDPATGEVAALLHRASFLHHVIEAIETLSMPRVVAAETTAVVVDAWAELRPV